MIREVLTRTRRIAVVGASPRQWRPSFGVTGFLVEKGYEVTPVNPGIAGRAIHGRGTVATLDEVVALEMVDVFRNVAHVGRVVDAAIRLGASVVWMQLGVIDQSAAARARAAGLTVVMDRCPVIEWGRLSLARGRA